MEDSQYYYLRLRGLPWASTKEDITSFLQNVNICDDENSIIFTTNEDGKRTGDALVKLPTIEDLEKALTYHRNYMGKRYIEVLKSSQPEFSAHEQNMSNGEDEQVIRLRGLPYSCVDSDIREFFQGLEIMPQGVVILRDNEGRCSGDAYVELYSAEDVPAALQRHRQKIGSRFIEVYRSSKSEMNYLGKVQATPLMSIHCRRKEGSPQLSRTHSMRSSRIREYDCYDDFPQRGPPMMMEYRDQVERFPVDYRQFPDAPPVEKYIHVRGLPFDCKEEDIDDFFYPIIPVSIGLCYGSDDRFNGESDVFFENEEDCTIALRNHKKRIGKRYAELFMRTRRIVRPRHKTRSYSNESFEKQNNLKNVASPPIRREYQDVAPSSASQFAPVSYPRLNQQPNIGTSQQQSQLNQNQYPSASYETAGQNKIKVINYPETTAQAQYADATQTTYISTVDYYKNLNANLTVVANESSDPHATHINDQKYPNAPHMDSNQNRFYNYY